MLITTSVGFGGSSSGFGEAVQPITKSITRAIRENDNDLTFFMRETLHHASQTPCNCAEFIIYRHYNLKSSCRKSTLGFGVVFEIHKKVAYELVYAKAFFEN